MKKISLILGAFITLFFISCEGPQGPPGLDGFDGQDGLDGSNFEAAAFEIEIDMDLNTAANRYEFLFEPYPSDITLLPDDVLLIYRLEEVASTGNGDVDVWRQLPQPFISNEGTSYYNFDFTLGDYSLYLEPEFDVNLVTSDMVLGQIFRIVVVPANLGTASKMDKSSIDAVMSSLGLEEKDIQKIKLN